MEIEPRHVFFLLFLSITLMLLGGIGEGVLSSPDSAPVTQTAFERLEHGDIAAKIGALWDIFNLNYDWLTPWLQWPFRILNWAFLVLIARQLWLQDYTMVETLKLKDLGRIHSGFKQNFIPSVIEQFQTKGYLSPFQREIIIDMLNDKDMRNQYRLRVVVGIDTKEDAIRYGYVTEKDLDYPFDLEKHRKALEVARSIAEHLQLKSGERLPMATWNPSGKQRPSWQQPWRNPRLSR